MNSVGLKLFGMQVIPDVMLTDVDSLKRAASENDISYGATGLAGTAKSKADGRRRDNSFHKVRKKNTHCRGNGKMGIRFGYDEETFLALIF